MTRAMAGLIQVLRNINRAIESVLNPVAMVLMARPARPAQSTS